MSNPSTKTDDLEAEVERLEQELDAARKRLDATYDAPYADLHSTFEQMAARLPKGAKIRGRERWPPSIRSVDWKVGDTLFDLCVTWWLKKDEVETIEVTLAVTHATDPTKDRVSRFTLKLPSLEAAVDGVFDRYEAYIHARQSDWKGRAWETKRIRRLLRQKGEKS